MEQVPGMLADRLPPLAAFFISGRDGEVIAADKRHGNGALLSPKEPLSQFGTDAVSVLCYPCS